MEATSGVLRIGLMVVSNTSTMTLGRSSQVQSIRDRVDVYGVTISCPGLPAMKGSMTQSSGTFR